MTPQEAQMLEDLVRKVEGTQLNEKDPDAEALLKDGLARDPDAIYKLAQTVLIQNLALEQAQARLQQMQQQLAAPPAQPAHSTSFLGGLLHRNPPQPQYQQPQYAPPSAPPPPQWQAVPPSYMPPSPGYAGAPSSGGGFLRSAATTAAGVAGGMLAFQGIESLLHGGIGGGGFGGGFGEPQETIVNNYYDSPQGGPDEQPQGPSQGPYDTSSDVGDPNEQPQGPYDASDTGGPDEQPQGPYDDGGGDQQDYVNDAGGGDFGSDPGGDGGGDGSDFV